MKGKQMPASEGKALWNLSGCCEFGADMQWNNNQFTSKMDLYLCTGDCATTSPRSFSHKGGRLENGQWKRWRMFLEWRHPWDWTTQNALSVIDLLFFATQTDNKFAESIEAVRLTSSKWYGRCRYTAEDCNFWNAEDSLRLAIENLHV